MPEFARNILGYEGVNYTTDPYVLGKKSPASSVLSYNYRADNGIRKARKGFETVVDWSKKNPYVDTEEYFGRFRGSGVYFPHGARAIVPVTDHDFQNNFYMADQDDWTIEFWMKCEERPEIRVISEIPVGFINVTKHFQVFITKKPEDVRRTRLCIQFAGNNSGTPDAIICQSPDAFNVETDGKWHHYAILRDVAKGYPVVMIDGGSLGAGSTHTMENYDGSSPQNTWDTLAEDDILAPDEPMFDNHLLLGGNEIHLAEWRMWTTDRTAQIPGNYIKPLSRTGSHANLACYVPFDEGEGKYFDEIHAYGSDPVRGYFSPQEPYVNDDDELVFTGYECLAYPSLRAAYNKEDVDLDHMSQDSPNHRQLNCDGGYEGGILWDNRLRNLDSTDTTTDIDHQLEGVWKGIAQIKFRLRQLKEGPICGRLGLLYDNDSGETKYRFYFFVDQYDESTTTDMVFVSDAVVDSSWIGVEKTLTVVWNGEDPDIDYQVGFYVNDGANIFDSYSENETWCSGDQLNDETVGEHRKAFADDVGNSPNGALGGADGGVDFLVESYLAFDLIYLRQWFHDGPYDGSDPTDFIADTYELEDLTDDYRYMSRGVGGYINNNSEYVTLSKGWNKDAGTLGDHLGYIRIPIHYGSDTMTMSDESGEYTYVYLDGTTDYVFKQDILVKRIMVWLTGGTNVQVLKASEYKYFVTASLSDKRYFSGADISNLLCEYGPKQFKENRHERAMYHEETTNIDTNFDGIHKQLLFFECINDGSPIQGIEQIGSATYKSKYLILSARGSRYDTVYGQKSLRARWSTGPIYNVSELPVRGIHRYISEDGEVNKLIMFAGCSGYELDLTNEWAKPLDYAWIDRNDDDVLDFLAVNNKLIVMNGLESIKLNYKDNWSRLGIERPVGVEVSVAVSGSYTTVDNFLTGEQYGYVAQFYDSENDAYSGTIPILAEDGQTIEFDGNTTTDGTNYVDVNITGCRDLNVDRFKIFRTLDMNGDGIETVLFLVNESSMERVENTINFRDVWGDTALAAANPILPLAELGVSLVPAVSKGLEVAYNRLFLFGSNEQKSTIFWSDVDGLGFPRPDMFPPANGTIVEEGGTSEGKALVEYSGQLFAFKDNAMFRINQVGANDFAPSLVYKGVGCVNQRCVLVAGNAIIFMDTNGIYRYSQGEPVMLSRSLYDYFRNEVNQDNIDNAFMLHNKQEEQILAFVPSSGKTYCDRCIVYDLQSGSFTIDLIPDVTCGYIDGKEDGSIYLGTPYGQVLKYSSDAYLDILPSSVTDTGTITSLTYTATSGTPFNVSYSLYGVPVYAVDSTNKKIWKGTVTSYSTSTLTVDLWEELFNASADPTAALDVTVYLGHIFLYDKTPQYTFNYQEGGPDSFNMYEKNLKELELLTNYLPGALTAYIKFYYNHSGNTGTHSLSLSANTDGNKMKLISGMHKNFQMEHALLTDDEFKLTETTYHVSLTKGKKDS